MTTPHRLLAVFLLLALTAHAHGEDVRQAPEFTEQSAQDWLNSPPRKLEDFRGKVILVDFWTFGCWNCYRSFPWLNALQERLRDQPFAIVGIHSPEFEHERDREEVKRQAARFGLQHPIMIDNDFSYWRAMGNRYWPAFYLIDANGNIRATYIGETHAGDKQARAIELEIESLIREAGTGS